jgi:adenine-specific DNA-methyltransferase
MDREANISTRAGSFETRSVISSARDETDLLSIAIALGAADVSGVSSAERVLAKSARPVNSAALAAIKAQITEGADPLGDMFAALRTPLERRELGATYTPRPIVQAMLKWATEQITPERVVDPGVGSARFLREAAICFPRAQLVGVEIDPLAALLARANLAASGFAARSQILLQDFRSATLKSTQKTLFIGNPPYVRHHQISSDWKAWLVKTARSRGLDASQLAGLHVYFFLATILSAHEGDVGALITAAEWLDVNYGKLVRDLFLGELGGQGIVVIEPTAHPFPDAATTAAITLFEIRSKTKSVRLRRVGKLTELKDLSGGRSLRRERLVNERRWSRLTFGPRECPDGYVELGELCRVHRGQVTGANRIWIAGASAADLPSRYLFPTVTKARELIAAGTVLENSKALRRVVDLPTDLDEIDASERPAVDRFLKAARRLGAHNGYVASHRRAWYSVGLREPAPILATYMARRAPAFARNLAEARHINVAHGLYPREPLKEEQLKGLVEYLSTKISVIDGRTYAGGLTKFEPGEMERLFVPAPESLATFASIAQ